MNNAPVNINRNTIGQCPHGLPMGGCPVCSGMGGGGGGKAARKNEMSWDDCYSIGLMLQAAQKNKQLSHEFQNQALQNAVMQNQVMALLAQKVASMINVLQNVIVAPIMTVLNNFKQATINFLKPAAQVFTNIANSIKNAFTQIKNKLPEIMDKLAAIFGEQAKSFQENLAKSLNKLQKKIFSLFEKIDGSMEQGDHEEERDRKNKKNKKKNK